MGRTCPTYRTLLEDEIRSWETFRRALRKEDQEAFDRLMEKVRTHASASSNAASNAAMSCPSQEMTCQLKARHFS